MALPRFNSPYCIEKRRFNEASEIQAGRGYEDLPPKYDQMELTLFPEGSLKNANNTTVPESHLLGKSVGIYFADGEDPSCKSFLPFLLQFYSTINESGGEQVLEVIFVSCDRDEHSFRHHVSHMPWLHVDFNHPLTDILRKHFRVLREYDTPLHGRAPKSGVPCVVVIGSDGREEQFLHVSAGRDEGERALLRWDWRNTKFTNMPRAHWCKCPCHQKSGVYHHAMHHGHHPPPAGNKLPDQQQYQQPNQKSPFCSSQQHCIHTCSEHPQRY